MRADAAGVARVDDGTGDVVAALAFDRDLETWDRHAGLARDQRILVLRARDVRLAPAFRDHRGNSILSRILESTDVDVARAGCRRCEVERHLYPGERRGGRHAPTAVAGRIGR